MNKAEILGDMFLALPAVAEYHAPDTFLYTLLKKVARESIENLFKGKDAEKVWVGPFGKLIFPYYGMGAVDSLNLFDLDELIIFSFYWQNRRRYKRVLDIGANLGLHSIILSKCGYEVDCYEPDPVHFRILKENLSLNNIFNIQPYDMAVSSEDGEMEFIRVLGNTTSSHLAGSKPNPYGELETISVKTKSIKSILKDFDLVKMDVEGHEKNLVWATGWDDWKNIDGVLSVHDRDNAAALYEHFNDMGINLFSQKISWHRVSCLEDMPMSHYEGSLFVTAGDKMLWL